MPRPTKRQKHARETFEKIAWRKIEKEHKEEIAANRKKLKRKNGKFVTKEEARCILSLFYSNLPRERSEAAAISKTATALMFSKGSVRNVVKTWQEDGELRIVTRKGKDTKQTAPQTTAEGDTP